MNKKIITFLVLVLIMGALFLFLNNENKIENLSMQEINEKVKIQAPQLEYSSINSYSLKKTDCVFDGVAEKIDGKEFIFASSSEGAAGSTYRTEDYYFKKNNDCYVFEFITRIPNCGNYSEIEKCENIENQEKGKINLFINDILIKVYNLI